MNAKRLGRQAAAALLGLLLAAVVAEVGLRVGRTLWPRLHGLTYSPTVLTAYEDVDSTRELLERSYLGYRPLAETSGFRLNARGFRTPPYGERKAPGTLRIVVLGDSFAFGSNGVPYDALWHQVAGRRLAAQIGRPVEVINLGVPAVGARFELRLWELEGRRLDPDLVVLGFFVGNDLTDEGDEPLESTLEGDLAQRSVLVRLVRNALRRRNGLATSEGAAPPAAGPPGTAGGTELPLTAGGFDPDTPLLTEKAWLGMEEGRLVAIGGPDTGRFQRLIAGANLLVERLAREIEASGARVGVVLIPDEGQVDRDLARRIERRSGFSLDLDRPQRRLVPWLVDRRIPHLDLLPIFRRRHDRGGPRLYRVQDTHWSVAGNRLAGERLAEWVMEERLLSAEP